MEEREVLRVNELVIEPNGNCPLNAPLSVSMKYTMLEPVAGAVWEMVYEADFTNKRQTIPIYTAPVLDLTIGEHTFHHAVPSVNTGAVKEKYLLQVGVLKLTLRGNNGTENVTSVNMVTQVSRDPATGTLLRNIMNPLE